MTTDRYPGVFIHRNADVSDDCIIGPGTKIWSGCVVRNGTIIGSNVSVGIGCALEGCTIGDDTHVNPHVLAGAGIVIGKRCFIAGNVIICNDAWPTADRHANGGWYPTSDWITVRIGDDTSIGSSAVIMPGVTIGNGCMIGATACVAVDVPDGMMFTRYGEVREIDHARIQRVRQAR